MMLGGGWVVSCGPGARFSQDDVKIEEQVSHGKIRAAGVERSHLCTEVVE